MHDAAAMDEEELVSRVRTEGGLRNHREARRAIGAVLGALRCAMAQEDADAIAAELPPPFGKIVSRPAAGRIENSAVLYAEVERRERVGLGFALEHCQVVLRVLAELVDPEMVVRLRKRVPADVAVLLRARADTLEPPPPHVHEHPAEAAGPRRTLSRGRPGPGDPIVDARHPLAHGQSVARSDAPHAERAIGTAHSTRPGREDEILAAARGRPPPK